MVPNGIGFAPYRNTTLNLGADGGNRIGGLRNATGFKLDTFLERLHASTERKSFAITNNSSFNLWLGGRPSSGTIRCG